MRISKICETHPLLATQLRFPKELSISPPYDIITDDWIGEFSIFRSPTESR